MACQRYPNLYQERQLWKRGWNYVIGLDEAGRGPLAGPVVAAAVWVSPETLILKDKKLKLLLEGVKDSKKLSPKKREELWQLAKVCSFIKWRTAAVSEKIIDKLNILEATKRAMARAVGKITWLKSVGTSDKKPELFLLIDGNIRLNLPFFQKAIIRGDEKVFSISLASIVAKVVRDRIMERYHQKYPQYGFDRHKGYPTKQHLEKLRIYKPCPIHRRSFAQVNWTK